MLLWALGVNSKKNKICRWVPTLTYLPFWWEKQIQNPHDVRCGEGLWRKKMKQGKIERDGEDEAIALFNTIKHSFSVKVNFDQKSEGDEVICSLFISDAGLYLCGWATMSAIIGLVEAFLL